MRYSLDRDISIGSHYPPFKQLDPGRFSADPGFEVRDFEQLGPEATTEALLLARLGECLEAIFTTKTKMS